MDGNSFDFREIIGVHIATNCTIQKESISIYKDT